MTDISLNDLNILRIMSRAFEGLDNIRIQTGDEFRVFGINPASTVYYNLFIQTHKTEEKGVSVSNKSFNSLLKLSLSEYLTGFKELGITISNEDYATFFISGKYSTIDETLINIPSGIKSEPPQIKTLDFSKAAMAKIQSPKDYRLVHEHFEGIKEFVEVEPIEIEIKDGGIEFNPYKKKRHLHKLKGEGKGNTRSLISLNNLRLTSWVAELKGISGLEIYVINNAAMKFKYNFSSGFLEYIVAKALEREI
ncbi:MAG: hypothetical protein R6U44_04265 [Archaeoglobaceae archaeon]